jgi:hypothetical protein
MERRTDLPGLGPDYLKKSPEISEKTLNRACSALSA